MAVLIWQRGSSGRARVCNSRCHDATKKACSCICAGINHGVGLEKALSNTWDMQRNYLPTEPKSHRLLFITPTLGPKKKDIVVDSDPQLPLTFSDTKSPPTPQEE